MTTSTIANASEREMSNGKMSWKFLMISLRTTFCSHAKFVIRKLFFSHSRHEFIGMEMENFFLRSYLGISGAVFVWWMCYSVFQFINWHDEEGGERSDDVNAVCRVCVEPAKVWKIVREISRDYVPRRGESYSSNLIDNQRGFHLSSKFNLRMLLKFKSLFVDEMKNLLMSHVWGKLVRVERKWAFQIERNEIDCSTLSCSHSLI